MQFIRKLEPFQNVVATGRAVLSSKLVLGNVIERVYLVLSGGSFTKAMITAVRVRLNGKVIFGDVSGSVLDLIQRYTLLNNTTGYLTIDFTEPTARSIQGQLMGAINTNQAGVTDFTIEVDISGATTPALDGWVQLRSPASMSPQAGFDPGLAPIIRALIPTTLPVTAANETQFDVNYGSGGTSLIKRLFVSSSILTSFRVKRNSLDIFETVAPALNTYMELDYGRVAQTNLYVWDPLVDGNQSDAIPTRANGIPANFQFLFTSSGAGSHLVFADVYSTLGGL
jgi:hypothetical protein